MGCKNKKGTVIEEMNFYGDVNNRNINVFSLQSLLTREC